jgi:hypothetical protein
MSDVAGDGVDWTAPATMLERDDSGSDFDISFRAVATGPLSALISQFLTMDAAERARVIIDRGAAGNLAFNDIMALAARADFPGA